MGENGNFSEWYDNGNLKTKGYFDNDECYKRINERLETLQKQMTLIQYETQELLTELDELRNIEIKTYKNGKK